MSADPTRTRDIVLIGCSAGGVEALPRIIDTLPADLPAAVCIVQHMSPTHTPYLVHILRRTAVLPVEWAEQGEPVVNGRVYVAPPDNHLIFSGDHITLTRTARENHARPSIDKLFRSGAAAFGARTIGVLLTGMLDDGVSGLGAIRRVGGCVVVQDPADAAYPDLPANAVATLVPDHVLPVSAIGAALVAGVQERVAPRDIPDAIALEAALDHSDEITPPQVAKLGPQSSVSCPDCGGPTWQLSGETTRYRCYLGHVVTARTLLADSTSKVELSLWSAVRALADRATTLETLADDAGRAGNAHAAVTYKARAREAREQSDVARRFMVKLSTS